MVRATPGPLRYDASAPLAQASGHSGHFWGRQKTKQHGSSPRKHNARHVWRMRRP